MPIKDVVPMFADTFIIRVKSVRRVHETPVSGYIDVARVSILNRTGTLHYFRSRKIGTLPAIPMRPRSTCPRSEDLGNIVNKSYQSYYFILHPIGQVLLDNFINYPSIFLSGSD